MKLSALINALRSQGVSSDQIVGTLLALDVDMPSDVRGLSADSPRTREDERREKDRERKRLARAKASDANSDSPRTSEDIADTEASRAENNIHTRAPVFSNGSSLRSEPELITPLPSEGPRSDLTAPKRSSGSALPENWSPAEELFAYGAELGLSREQTAEILEGMRLWAHANRNRAVARKADWSLTMKGAIRRDAAKFKAREGPPRGDRHGGIAALMRETMDAMRLDDERRDAKQIAQASGDFGDVLGLPLLPPGCGGG